MAITVIRVLVMQRRSRGKPNEEKCFVCVSVKYRQDTIYNGHGITIIRIFPRIIEAVSKTIIRKIRGKYLSIVF